MKKLFTLIVIALAGCGLLEDHPSERVLAEGAEVKGVTVGIKTYGQVFQTFDSVTGMGPIGNSPILAAVTNAKFVLSSDGDPLSISASTTLAITALAGVYCDQLARKDAALPADSRRAFHRVDFTKNQTLLTEDIRHQLAEKFAFLFWQREITDEEMNIVLEAQREAEVGRPLNTTETRMIAVVPCVVIGSSLDAIKN